MTSVRSGAGNESVLDCTTGCRMPNHALKSHSCVALGDINLVKRLTRICGNPYKIADEYGRCSIHVAASLGHSDIVAWLSEHQNVDVDQQDLESKWTPLHRSLYFGHLQTALTLIKLGANLSLKDRDGWTALDLVNSDLKDKCVGFRKKGIHTISTWGVNANTSLGHEHSRDSPETLSMPVDQDVRQVQVVLCKFHSVFLTSTGRVLTCGLGRGGRLGHGNELTLIAPAIVSELSKVKIIQVAASRDHTVFLAKTGTVYTCGLNEAHQLGHGTNPATAPPNLLAPKPIKVVKFEARGVGAGRFHTAVSTGKALYTFGEDHGQLGYKAKYETQVTPRQVPGIELHNDEEITLLSASDAATACFTSERRIFLCYDYTVRTITLADQFTKREMVFTQFAVCATLGDYERKKKQILTSPVITSLLDSDGRIWYWTLEHKVCRQVFLRGTRNAEVIQFFLGKKLSVTTEMGEVFIFDTKAVSEDITGKGLQLTLSGCRMSGIQNAQAVFTDFKGSNFALAQEFNCPAVDSFRDFSNYASELGSLRYSEETFPDCSLKVGDYSLSCHSCVLAGRSDVLRSMLEKSPSAEADHTTPTLDVAQAFDLSCVRSSSLLLFVDYLYSVDTSFTVHVHRREHAQRSLSEDTSSEPPPQRSLQEGEEQEEAILFTRAASHADFIGFCELLSKTCIAGVEDMDRQTISKGRYRVTLPNLPPLKYMGKSLLMADFYIESSTKDRYSCHRSILVTRSDFFRSMLTMGWKESYSQDGVSLPFSSRSVELVLEYLYTDHVKDIHNLMNEAVMELLIVTDQLLLNGLRQICETELAHRVTLREAIEMAEFSHLYNAPQLFIYCLQLVCFNLSFFLEGNHIFGMSTEVLLRLNKVYQDTVPATKRRVMRVDAPESTGFFADLLHDGPLAPESVSTTGSLVRDAQGAPSTPVLKSQSTGRKRRKRKPSKSDSTGSLSSKAVITEEEKTLPRDDSVKDERPSLTDVSNQQRTVLEHETKMPSKKELFAVQNSKINHSEISKSEANSPVVSDVASHIDGDVFVTVGGARVRGKSPKPSNQLVNQLASQPANQPLNQPGKKVTNAPKKWTQLPSLQNSISFQQIQREQSSKPSNKVQNTSDKHVGSKPQPSSSVPLKVPTRGLSGPSKSSPPWGKVAQSPPVTSLKDVMNEEVMKLGNPPRQSVQAPENKPPSPSSPVPTVWGRPVTGSPSAGYDKGYLSPPTSPISMATIMADEKQRMSDPMRLTVKSLDCIEIEERAIEVLQAIYSTEGNADEWITVERDTKLTEAPVWVKEFR